MNKDKELHSYGWRPDVPDFRDYTFSVIRKPTIEILPSSIDLRQFCSKIEDQGNLGSCTAQALVGNLEFLEVKDNVHFSDLSTLFLYFNERVIEHSTNYDSGAELRDGIKTLKTQGVCKENLWPYSIFKYRTKPTPRCYLDASSHKVIQYARLNTLEDMRTCLADGFPFVFGFAVYDSFESDEVAKTGIIPMPNKSEQLLGGHAVMTCGYNDDNKTFIVRNSWGIEWADKGYCYMPYNYLTDRNLSDDLWTIRRAQGM